MEPTVQQRLEVRLEPAPQPELARPQGTSNQWLRWIRQQVVGVVTHIEEEEKAQRDQLFATIEELEKAQAQIKILEEALEEAKADAAREVLTGPSMSKPMAPVHLQTSTEPVASTEPESSNAQEQELSNLREELVAQEALRARDREQKKTTEEEK